MSHPKGRTYVRPFEKREMRPKVLEVTRRWRQLLTEEQIKEDGQDIGIQHALR
jgi:hypothetical protein